MANRHVFTVPVPSGLHGENLKDEIKQETGLRSVDVVFRDSDQLVEVSIPGDRPRTETDALERQIRTVAGQHKGVTSDQEADLQRRSTAQARLADLAAKVGGGGVLTGDEIHEAVTAWLLQASDPPRRFN